MKESKNIISRFLITVSEKIFTKNIYSFILFLKSFNKFKREINKKMKNNKFSTKLDSINEYEFRITSQNNEDGIIDYIFKKIPNNKFFVEIGFDFYEFNTLNLIKNGWNGKLFEINLRECLALKKLLKYFFPKSNTQVLNKKIDKENINDLVFKDLNGKTIDFFSIDTDGNDYWLLKNLNLDRINVICCEYNHWIGKDAKKTIPYNPNHKYKYDYFGGASLLAMHDLLENKGFKLIAVDSSGTNAFFVKNEFSNLFEILSPYKSWRSSNRFVTNETAEEIKNNIKKFDFVDL